MPQKQKSSPPKDFGWRYVLWYTWLGMLVAGAFIWRNAITILSIISTFFAAITLNDNQTLVSHETYHYILICSFMVTAILAQVKRNGEPKKGKK